MTYRGDFAVGRTKFVEKSILILNGGSKGRTGVTFCSTLSAKNPT